MIGIYIICAILLVILIYFFVTYNNLIKLKNQVKEAFSTMDIYLKKRWDLIPNIVETVKGYSKYEKETLGEIVEIRSKAYNNMSDGEKVNTNNQLSGKLEKLMIEIENYPDLKASENYLDLSHQLVKVEEDIANSRKYYNGAVKVYNNKIQMFPSNLVASLLKFEEQNMFEINITEKENVKVKLEGNNGV